eukprot:scaffold272341_cov40-Tisochrysis_lutea.AAC.2
MPPTRQPRQPYSRWRKVRLGHMESAPGMPAAAPSRLATWLRTDEPAPPPVWLATAACTVTRNWSSALEPAYSLGGCCCWPMASLRKPRSLEPIAARVVRALTLPHPRARPATSLSRLECAQAGAAARRPPLSGLPAPHSPRLAELRE